MKLPYILMFSIKNIIYKKERSKLSLFAILLVTAILYISLTISLTLFDISRQNFVEEKGNYHYVIHKTENIELSNHYEVTKELDTGKKLELNGDFFEIHVFNNQKVLPFTIVEGVFPKNNDEVIVSNQLSNSEIAYINTFYKVVGLYEASDIVKNKQLYTYNSDGEVCTYYVRDHHIEWQTSLSGLAELMGVSVEEIGKNQELISANILHVYLEEPKNIYLFFFIISSIAIYVSFITIKNVILVSDFSRKKELGLLKSIGMTPKQIKQLIGYELLFLGCIGSLLGISLGIIVSYGILGYILNKLSMTINLTNCFRLESFAFSLITSLNIVRFSGFNIYNQYIMSMPIDDLQTSYNICDKPIKNKSVYATSFSWKMFLFYNRRLKFQTDNIRKSFILLLISVFIFSFVTMMNILYKKNNVVDECDIIVKNETYDGTYSRLNLDFVYALYDEQENGEIEIEYVIANRVSNYQILTREKSYDPDHVINLKQRKTVNFIEDQNKHIWCDQYFYSTFLDERQLEVLKEYIVDGDIINLTKNSFVCILTRGKLYGENPTYYCKIGAGSTIGIAPNDVQSLKQYVTQNDILSQNLHVQVVANLPRATGNYLLPYEVLCALHLPFENTQHIMAQSVASLLNQEYFSGTEEIKIKLKNPSLILEFKERLDEMMNEYHVKEQYTYEISSYSQEVLNTAIYMMDCYIYPLVVLLLIISLFNLFIVLKGNILVKQSDFSIMKSVGMSNSQTNKILLYEYLEGYINASFFICILFLVNFYALSMQGVSLVSHWSTDIYAVLMMTIMIIGPILCLPIVLVSFYRIRKIWIMKNSSNII